MSQLIFYQPIVPKEKEIIYYIKLNCLEIPEEELKIIKKLLPNATTETTLPEKAPKKEYGSDFHFISSWTSISLEVFRRLGLNSISMIVKTFRCLESVEYRHDPLLEVRYPVNVEKTDNYQHIPLVEIPIEEIPKYNQEYGLALDLQDCQFYQEYFKSIERNPNLLELYDLGQSNSEHSRHWFFNGKMEGRNDSLFKMVKKTHQECPHKSLVAFADNSSVIRGLRPTPTINLLNNQVEERFYHYCLTAETHNFPTGICPFAGANTGVGGRIRDTLATGKGALMVAGGAGYSVGSLENKRAKEILIEASNGASDYGNKVGEPIIYGFCRSYAYYNNDVKYPLEFIKPIMFSCGLGLVDDRLVKKDKPSVGDLIVRLGGPTYQIGLGGGSLSSNFGQDDASNNDWKAVQRGDPQMENRMLRVIHKACFIDEPVIISIHDQGAGGMGNVTKEISAPCGGVVDLRKITLGDSRMKEIEIWNSESQEQVSVLVKPERVWELEELARSENCPIEIFGCIEDTGTLSVIGLEGNEVANFDLEKLLENVPQKKYYPKVVDSLIPKLSSNKKNSLFDVLSHVNVGSKEFLTSKVDRSVSGLIVQQQTCGWNQVPISDYSLIGSSYFDTCGVASSIGERHLGAIGTDTPEKLARLVIGESLTNLIGSGAIYQEIKFSGNWMWSAKIEGYDHLIVETCHHLCQTLLKMGLAIDGGKDSLSMVSKKDNQVIISPPTLVMTSYAPVENYWKSKTPDLKQIDGSYLYFLDMSRMELNHSFKEVWEWIQKLDVLAIHDRSDGGLITTILEMAFGSFVGLELDCDLDFLEEELGLVFQVKEILDEIVIREILNLNLGLELHLLGKINLNHKNFSIKLSNKLPNKLLKSFNKEIDNKEVDNQLSKPLEELYQYWHKPSLELEKEQRNLDWLAKRETGYFTSFLKEPFLKVSTQNVNQEIKTSAKALIIREDGSNGDREMMAFLINSGYLVENLRTMEIKEKVIDLLEYDLLAFVGGFSFSDIYGAGRAWAESILSDEYLSREFAKYYQHPDKRALGVCNGCQLMVALGWIDGIELVRNQSESFESWWLNLELNSLSNGGQYWMKGVEEMRWGCWVAHGEGQFKIRDSLLFNKKEQVIFRYSEGNNPNGSDDNIAGIVSRSGRHLAMMPHPERSFLKSQDPTPGCMLDGIVPWEKLV